jgi:hypothetical protein
VLFATPRRFDKLLTPISTSSSEKAFRSAMAVATEERRFFSAADEDRSPAALDVRSRDRGVGLSGAREDGRFAMSWFTFR